MTLPRYVPHYTREDYEMWEGDWELWSGVPIAMTPSANRRHQKIAGNLHFQLKKSLAETGCKDCEVLYELDWHVSEDTILRPDLVVICRHAPSQFIEKTPSLVAEVLSDSSRRRDQLYKREMYETLGVRYYLILDPRDATSLLLELTDRGYQPAESGVLRLHEDCQVSLGLDGLF